jgi:hypothetical protein
VETVHGPATYRCVTNEGTAVMEEDQLNAYKAMLAAAPEPPTGHACLHCTEPRSAHIGTALRCPRQPDQPDGFYMESAEETAGQSVRVDPTMRGVLYALHNLAISLDVDATYCASPLFNRVMDLCFPERIARNAIGKVEADRG